MNISNIILRRILSNNEFKTWMGFGVYKWNAFKRSRSLYMSEVYADNMVLQSNIPLKIRGHALPGDHIIVSLGDVENETFTGSDGRWCVVLPALKAGYKTYILRVRNKRHQLVFRNVVIGEVWLIAGASVMLMSMKNAVTYLEELKSLDKKTTEVIRFYKKKENIRNLAIEWPIFFCWNVNKYRMLNFASWQTLQKENLCDVPAYAYYFAKRLSRSLDVPVGLVCMAVSGTPIDSWIERELLAVEMPDFLMKDKVNCFSLFKEAMCANIRKSKNPDQKHYNSPAFCFESQLRPLEKFPIKGILYGGFPFGGEITEPVLKSFFTLFIKGIRMYWQEELPVYYLQLFMAPGFPILPFLRDWLRKLEKNLSHVGMVTYHDTIDYEDVCKDIDWAFHPLRRKEVGERFARLALYDLYEQDVVRSGPVFHKALLCENLIRIRFDWSNGLCTSDGNRLRSFELAASDYVFFPVEAVIIDDEVIINYVEVVNDPRYVRYGWKDFSDGNLVNGEMLPTSTFCEKIEAKNFTIKTKIQK